MTLTVLYKSTLESGYGYYNEFIIKEQGIILHNTYATKTLQLKGLDCIIQNDTGILLIVKNGEFILNCTDEFDIIVKELIGDNE